jgi:hypothetical protein
MLPRWSVLIFALVTSGCVSNSNLRIDRPMPTPRWAHYQRQLLEAYGAAADEFAAKYLDQRGFFRCLVRWGANDGPDDVMENFSQWPLVYAMGGPENLLDIYRRAQEGHFVQYTQARVPSIEMARDGMYYKEFITSFDWEHNGEGLAAFYFYGLAHPEDPAYRERTRRFASFYLNEDPGAPNYDPKLKIIRSLHNGSRGPKLTHASEKDWGGEPVPGKPERLTRYSTAGNVRGDNPLNLLCTTLAMNAFMLTGEQKYRDWLLEYTTAWRDRVLANRGNIPTNVGLDGQVGSEWGGTWYGGVYGWDFWPESNLRNVYLRGPRVAFGAAFMLTGDPWFVEPLRRQIANLYAARLEENGVVLLPNKYGDQGFYGYTPNQFFEVQRDIYFWEMRTADREHIAKDPWMAFLTGTNPGYPEVALQEELARVKRRVDGIRADASTPETRASDHPQKLNPVAAAPLVYLTLGGNDPGISGNILHSQVRYFDPERRRAGLPEEVAALVEQISPAGVVLTLVNTSSSRAHRVIIQAGAYGEHHFVQVSTPKQAVDVDGRCLTLELAPAAGETLTLAMRRYAHQPELRNPW